MNYKNTVLIVVVTYLAFTANVIAAQPLSPEMLMMQQVINYDKIGKTQEEFDQLFQTATFLNDPQVAQNLISQYLQTTSRDERWGIHIIILYMTCQPEQMIMARLETETEPWKKARLLTLLDDFYGEDIFLALIRQLDDTRPVILPPERLPKPSGDFRYNDLQRRVCDVAYLDVVSRLFRLGFLSNTREFDPPPFPSFDEMDTFITKFKQYWEEHKTTILEELPMKPRPATIMDAVVIKPKPQPPEIAMIAQVKAYIAEHRSRADLDALMQTAPFLNSPDAVESLLQYVWDLQTLEGLTPIRVMLLYMTCHPDEIIAQSLITEHENAWQKTKLFILLTDFYTEPVLEQLSWELDDCSLAINRSAPATKPTPRRVCDVAYDDLFHKFEVLSAPGYEALRLPSEASEPERETMYATMIQYWSAHRAAILDDLPNHHPVTILDELF